MCISTSCSLDSNRPFHSFNHLQIQSLLSVLKIPLSITHQYHLSQDIEPPCLSPDLKRPYHCTFLVFSTLPVDLGSRISLLNIPLSIRIKHSISMPQFYLRFQSLFAHQTWYSGSPYPSAKQPPCPKQKSMTYKPRAACIIFIPY